MSLTRPSAIARAAASLVLAAGMLGACHSEDEPVDVLIPADTAQATISAENQVNGTTDWELGLRADPDSLAVWASPYVGSFGDTLDIYIHAAKNNLRVEVFRLGWYGGKGGRRLTSTVLQDPVPQPPCTPAFPAPTYCPWKVTLRVPIEPNWTGGWYIVRVEDGTHRTTAYPFVIRSRRQHAFVAVVPQFTWQAYNSFGGSSLYIRDPANNRVGPTVSFARPYIDAYDADPSRGTMGGTFDLQAVRWLERYGYDVGYASDLDLAGPIVNIPEPVKGFIFLGHDEYWTWDERNNVEAYRDAGKHLMFLAANAAYWNIRLHLGPKPVTGRPGELITSYKGLPDPGATSREETTVRFREAPLNRPENALYGIMFDMLLYHENRGRYVVPPDSERGPEAAGFLAAAGLAAGDSLAFGTNPEGDDISPNGSTPAGLQTLLVSYYPIPGTAKVQAHRTTFFIAPSGAGVFASGTNSWTYHLEGPEEDPKVGQLMNAVLAWMMTH